MQQQLRQKKEVFIDEEASWDERLSLYRAQLLAKQEEVLQMQIELRELEQQAFGRDGAKEGEHYVPETSQFLRCVSEQGARMLHVAQVLNNHVVLDEAI